jgi:hypothetical protein
MSRNSELSAKSQNLENSWSLLVWNADGKIVVVDPKSGDCQCGGRSNMSGTTDVRIAEPEVDSVGGPNTVVSVEAGPIGKDEKSSRRQWWLQSRGCQVRFWACQLICLGFALQLANFEVP